VAFVKERQAILQAAKVQEENNANTSTDTKKMRLTIPASTASLYPPPGRQFLKDILLRYVSDFHNPKFYANVQLTYLNHIASMTNCDQSGRETAHLVASMVMGDEEIGLRDILVMMISRASLVHEDEMSIMKRHAVLRILANCLSILFETSETDEENWTLRSTGKDPSKGESFKSVTQMQFQGNEEDNWIEIGMEHSREWLVSSLLPSLVENIGECKCWHNVSISCECLRLLLEKDETIRRECETNEELLKVLEDAVLLGKESHARLYREAQGAMDLLTDRC